MLPNWGGGGLDNNYEQIMMLVTKVMHQRFLFWIRGRRFCNLNSIICGVFLI